MKHKFSFVITLWWVLLLGFLGGMIIWLAPKEERISEVENRNLAGAPSFSLESIVDSSFMSGVERYLADGFFNRLTLIETAANIKGVFDIKGEDEMDVDMEQAVHDFMDEAETDNPDNQGKKPSDDNAGDDESNNIITIENQDDNDDSSEGKKEYTYWLDFTDGGTRIVYDYPVENLDVSINALNAYRGALPEDGELHFFQIPYGYLANMLIYRPDKYAGWGCDAEDYMSDKADAGVIIHNGPEILEPYLLDGQMLYYRTDYHWSALGAYYGHMGMMQDCELPYIEYEDYEYTIFEKFIGSGYGKNPSAEIRSKADRLELMHTLFPTESYTIANLTEHSEAPLMYYNLNSYLAYVGGTWGPWRRFITGADSGRNALIVTDSFGNAFAPYLFAYYDEVHMLDLRPAYYSKHEAGASVREYIEEYEIDDAYIMLSTSSSMNSGYMLNLLMKYLD